VAGITHLRRDVSTQIDRECYGAQHADNEANNEHYHQYRHWESLSPVQWEKRHTIPMHRVRALAQVIQIYSLPSADRASPCPDKPSIALDARSASSLCDSSAPLLTNLQT
jgi:hypothetical protein